MHNHYLSYSHRANTAPCANLAAYDVYQWKLRLNANSGVVPAGALPNGQGSVVAATDPTGRTTVTIVLVTNIIRECSRTENRRLVHIIPYTCYA